MVLESILSKQEALKHPFFMLITSCFICSISLWVAFLSFPRSASILSIAFVTIALTPLFHTLFKAEEEKEAERPGYAALFLARHFNLVKVYAFFFIGLILTFAFWYSIVGVETRAVMFAEQEATLEGISNLRETLTGNFSVSGTTCGLEPMCWFTIVFVNNAFYVMMPAVIFSFVFGAGAVFLIGWNASVLGVLIGKDIVQFAATHGGVTALTIALDRALGLVPHGLFESLGYFVGAIAGGIIGAAISKKRHLKGEMGTVAKDVIILLLYALGFLVIGGIIEAYVIVASLA